MATLVRVYGRVDPPALERARVKLAANKRPPEAVEQVIDGASTAVEARFTRALSVEEENAVRGALVEALFPDPGEVKVDKLARDVEALSGHVGGLDAKLDAVSAKLDALLDRLPPAVRP